MEGGGIGEQQRRDPGLAWVEEVSCCGGDASPADNFVVGQGSGRQGGERGARVRMGLELSNEFEEAEVAMRGRRRRK